MTAYDMRISDWSSDVCSSDLGGLSTLIHVHGLGTAMLLARLGTEAQKKAWLGKMASGEAIGAVCLTEPSAGSDLSALTGRAPCAEGGWVLKARQGRV